MKKITLLIAFFLAIVTGGYGQSAATYDFASSVGTYTQTSAAATLLPTVRADTSISTAQNIGFTFVYEGANYTQFKMGSNGFISLNATGTATLGTNNFSTANATSRPIIAPLWDDLDGASPASSVASYELTGTAPNRVLTVEWRNWEWNWNSATPVISFQAKLYETTNVIEFVYRQEATAVASGSASIGIGSATGSGAGSFLNLTDVITPAVSSLTANTTISVKPITGRIFSFTPASCFKPGGITASAITQTTATVSWNATVPAPATGYEYVVSTSNVAPAGAGTATTNLSEPVIGLAASTTYYIFVRSNCGAGFSSWNGPVAFTTLCNAVAVPWTENFDALTAGTNVFPSCWAYANTTNTWSISTTPVANSGANSLRRTWSTDGWAFSPMTTLVAGTSYTFSYYVRTNDNVVGYDITIGTGTGQTAGDMTNTLSAVTGYQGPTWTKVTHEFTPTVAGDYSFGVRVVAGGAPNGINFDDFTLEETPSCLEPSLLTATNMTATSADLSWTENGSATSWNVEWGATPFTQGTGTLASGVTNPYNLTGLSANTTYQYYVQADCGGSGTSTWAGPYSFTTPCTAIAVPWTENFDALTAGTNVFPSCWAYANTTNTWSISTTPVANSGANSLRRTWSTDGWAFTPLTTLVAGTSYTFSYYVRTNDNVVGYDITIGTGTGQTAGDMTNTLSAVTGYQGPTWTKVTHEFTPTVAGDYSFGVHVVAPNAPNGINFDDFVLEETPSCLEPTVLTATNMTANSADLSWTENGSATSWNVEWGATPFTQGTGTLASGVTNPYNLTGLSGNTAYQYYVQADCGGSGTSTWAGPYSFTTLCDAFPAPYTEAFENAGTIPSCWSMSGGEIWRFANTGTGNHIGNNGVITGTTTSGGYFAWVDDSSPDFADVTLTSPLIDASTLTAPRLTFFELSNNEGNQNSTLTVEVWDGAAWNNVAVYNTNTVGGWEKKIVSLSALTITGNIQVRFIYSGDTTGFYDDIAIDDVTIEESPLCLEPSLLAATNLTATSADLSWTENGSATSWNVEWGATPFTQGTGTLATGVTNPYNLAGLSANTSYEYYVQADCGGSGTSAWVGPYSFTTPCAAIAVPWTENFDALTPGVNVFPSCWAYTNTLKTWEISNIQVANSGANSLRRTWSTDGWAFTPLTTLVAGTSYTFSYYVKTNDTTVGYDITIGTGIGQTVVDMTNTLSAVTGYQGPTWTKVTHEFTPTVAGDYSFGVHVVAPLAPNGINFDDFVLEETPSCIAPIATASNITSTSVDITWPAISGNYEYVLDSVATDPAGAGTVLVGETYNGTLTPETTYYFHVRTDCGAGSFSTWTTISFTSLATPPVNDDCSAPIALTPGGVFTDQDIDTTNMGGTLSAETPSPTCGTSLFATSGKDVWYSVIVPASGALTIETDVTTAGTGLLLDTVIQVYSGACGALVTVSCDDSNGNTGTPAGADYSKLSLIGQTPGATLLIRAFGWEGTQGNFSISAYDASLSTRSFDTTGFLAYPNPVKDVLNLSYTTPISSVSVHNLLGQEVMTKSINATQSKIDMSNLSNGTYLVKVTVDGLVKTLKVVKQ